MIQIKDINKENFWEVAELTENVNGIVTVLEPCMGSAASSITEVKDNPEYIPRALYWNDGLIGFFMYKQTDEQPEQIEIFHFMLDCNFIGQGLGQQSCQAIFAYAKDLGKTAVMHGPVEENTIAKSLYTSLGFILGKLFYDDSKVI